MRNMGDPEIIEARFIGVNWLKGPADDVPSCTLTDVFYTHNPIRIMRFEDSYDRWKIATDKCEDIQISSPKSPFGIHGAIWSFSF